MSPARVSASDSDEQRTAEAKMLDVFATEEQVTLTELTSLPDGTQVQVDGFSEQPPILCEACAHQGSPKSGQKRKIIADAFKLVFAERVSGTRCRKVILLADDEAAAPFTASADGPSTRTRYIGRTWVAEAFRQLDIEVKVIALPQETRDRIRAAQVRQRR